MNDIYPDNVSVGVDIEEIGRFSGLTVEKDKAFLNKIFSKNELKYCYSKKDPAQHLTARFAGKEAVIKALFGFNFEPLPHNKIEILNNDKGVPYVRMDGDFSVKISLSHSGDNALAFVVIIKQ
ncbi:MAG: holo-ACP synthase [Candidatus Pacebacteria bacterium]|jgi:holo-[acyl-carrier protein] synthase|nr:holo-ACP synthase [Candidatus Paceibacterota bacterium]